MNQEKKSLLIRYLVCFGVAIAITVAVFAICGFFTDDPGVNMQILSDGFSISGMLFLLFAGIMYVSSEGALLGISFILRNVALAFIPMGRKHHETYKQYRERKLGSVSRGADRCILITGLVFFAIGMVFTVIWYKAYYTPPV